MSDVRTVLVTGASGALGPIVLDALRTRGDRVRALALMQPEPALANAADAWFVGDICDRHLLDAATTGASHVVHMAALLHINNPAPELTAEYERVNVHGTAAVVDAALRHGVKRLVFLSTIAVYGGGRGELLTEDAPLQPATPYAATKLAAERIVLNTCGDDGFPFGTVLRLAAVYGSRIKGNYNQLVTALARGRFVPVGRGENRRTLVQEKDVANAIALALDAEAMNRVYNVTDGEVHTLREIIHAICGALGRPAPRVALPAGPVRAAARLADEIARPLGFSLPVSSVMLEKYLEDVAVDGGRLRRELGYRPAYDLAAGWREAVAGMRSTGALRSG